MSERDATMEDWAKVLWITAVAPDGSFPDRESLRAPCRALFGWDHERFEVAWGEFRRRLREREAKA